MPDIIDDLYNAFDPFDPLPAGDPRYVNCREVRGDEDIEKDLGWRMTRSRRMTCQLYSGHRGAGKSTELRRLKKFLEERHFHVVYFEADEEDIEPEDTQYTDILLACTRRLLESLKEVAKPTPLINWLQSRGRELWELASMEVEFDKLTAEAQLFQFAKLTANVRNVPSMREKIRNKVDAHTVTLLEALNTFIKDAKRNLPNGAKQLAVITDNLDRIVPIYYRDRANSNHEEIFIDRSEQLRGLDCHVTYTVPISLVYSRRANDLHEVYGDTQVLPMVMVKERSGKICDVGMTKLQETIAQRVTSVASLDEYPLASKIFDTEQTLVELCTMSGGHMRNLMMLVQEAISEVDVLPLTGRAVRRAIAKTRDVYRRTVEQKQWQLLAEVSRSKRLVNEDECRDLMFNRCLLEYRYYEGGENLERWYDVHPMIRDIPEFKDALASVEQQ